MHKSQIFNMGNTNVCLFNTIHENKIISKISEFIVFLHNSLLASGVC